MAEENSQPLLKKKHYHENCPGCKVDQTKETTQRVPIQHLLNIWMVVMCSSLPITSCFPFIYFMWLIAGFFFRHFKFSWILLTVRDFHIVEREEDIGSYAGYLGSAYMVGRALTAVLWGLIADRYGRKPVIIIGVFAVIIFNTMFGLSTNFWVAVSARFLLGSLNGLLGPIKAYAVEVFREEQQPLALSTVSAAWGIGLIIGPALGGYLAQPVEKYPHIFSKNSLWDKFPYCLPSFVTSVLALVVLIGCIWLPETLHKHNSSSESTDNIYALESGSSEDDTEKIIEQPVDENLFLNWPLMSSVIVYCIVSLYDYAYQEVFSLWAVSPRRLGGLGFSTDDVGNVLSITGLAMIIYQLSLYPSVQRTCGPVHISRIAGALSIPLLQSYPFIAMLSGFTLVLMLNIVSALKNIMSVTITTGLFFLQNRAVEQHQRGAANGIAMTGMSVFKAIGPAGGGAVFSWSQKRINATFLPGAHMVFFVLNILELLAVLLMFKPFLKEKKTQPQ